MTSKHQMWRLLPGCAVAVICGALSPAQADFTGAYASATQYTIKFTHMPDLDQRRSQGPGVIGLPGDGNMYCVPTSAMNLFAYAANHGYPDVMPGAAWWQSQSKYNQAGASLTLLGSLMSTDAIDGTNALNAQFGANIWLHDTLMTSTTAYAAGNWSPTITDIAQAAISGGIVAFAYGRYTYVGESQGVHFVTTRNGGHQVTLAEAQRSGSQIVIKVRDPADEPDMNTDSNWPLNQSPFTTKSYNTAKQLTVFDTSTLNARTHTAIIYPPTANSSGVLQLRLIDSIFIVRPMWGLTWQPGINNEPPKLKIKMPQFIGTSFNSESVIDVAGMQNLTDIAIGIDPNTVLAIGESSPGVTPVKKINLITSEVSHVTTLLRTTHLAFGRKRELYALSNEKLVCINPDLLPEEGNDPVVATVFPPGPCTGLAYDDARDEVVLLCPSQRKIFRYQHRLPVGAGPHIQCIPEHVEMAGDGSVHVNPVDGKVWFITQGSSAIYHVPDDPQCDPEVEMISFGEIDNPTSITFDDTGDMRVVCDDGIKRLRLNPRLNRWEIIPCIYFAGFTPGPKFYVTRSMTNYDPLEHDGPQWNHVDPSEEQGLPGTTLEVDCLADLVSNATLLPPPDGIVNGADLAYLIGEWGANADSPADIVTSAFIEPPGDGIVDGADLAFLIGAWGECPHTTE